MLYNIYITNYNLMKWVFYDIIRVKFTKNGVEYETV